MYFCTQNINNACFSRNNSEMSPSKCFERQQLPSRRIFFSSGFANEDFECCEGASAARYPCSHIFCSRGALGPRSIGALMPSLGSCTINSCQQVQNDVQVLSGTCQRGQSWGSPILPSSFPIYNLRALKPGINWGVFKNNLKLVPLSWFFCVLPVWLYAKVTKLISLEEEIRVLQVNPAAQGWKRSLGFTSGKGLRRQQWSGK